MKLWRSTAIACALAGALGVAPAANALTVNETFNGFYVEVGDTSNRGINLELFKVAPELWVGFVTGFTYDAAGNQVWFSGTDSQVRPGDISIDFNINLATGGNPFGGAQTPSNADVQGTGSLVVNTCNSVELSLNTDAGSPIPAVSDLALDRGESLLGSIGVVGPDECVFQQAFAGCPAFSGGSAEAITGIPRSCVISGTFEDSITLTNSITWVMNGAIFIGSPDGVNNNNSSVTIEPGTRIVASGAQGREAFIISRGARIFAAGQPYAPIVFSSIRPTTVPGAPGSAATSGDFGGLVINGAARANDCPDFPDGCDGEGNSGLYNGNDPFDSSGIVRYVRVQFGGDSNSPDDELNGLALQGVGAGTVIDYVQIHGGTDDGLEFFGGTVRATHIVSSSNEDDSIDWTDGWIGSIQYAVVQQSAGGSANNGVEADNNSNGETLTPRSQPQLANVTLLGGASGDTGLLLRAGTGINITNSLVQGFNTCLDIDDLDTFSQSINGSGGLNGTLTINNTVLNCSNAFSEEGSDGFDVSDFFNDQSGNLVSDPGLNGIFPPNGAFYLQNQVMDPNVFGALDLVEFSGAFQSEATAWTTGWTEFL